MCGAGRQAARVGGEVVFGERRLVGYTAAQMFGVVADVGRYAEFVPYCRRSAVTLSRPDSLAANLTIGFPPLLHLSYTSHLTLLPPHLVTAVCRDLTLLRHLRAVWRFTSLPADASACEVDFAVSFAFTSAAHQAVARLVLDRVVAENVASFVRRAGALHGAPSRPSTVSEIVRKQ